MLGFSGFERQRIEVNFILVSTAIMLYFLLLPLLNRNPYLSKLVSNVILLIVVWQFFGDKIELKDCTTRRNKFNPTVF